MKSSLDHHSEGIYTG